MHKKSIIIFSAFFSPLRSGAEACAEEVSLRLCNQYDITIITARMRRNLPRRDMLQGKVPIVRVGLGCSFDKWLFPFLAPLAVRRLSKSVMVSPSNHDAKENVILRPSFAKPAVGRRAQDDTQQIQDDMEAQNDIGHQNVIIHAILETFAGLALHFCRYLIPSAKRILTMQTTNRSFLKGLIVRSADHVTAISSVLVSMAKERGREEVTLIPNGIDLAQIPDGPKVSGRILFVGRLEEWKGVDTLLTAFAELGNSKIRKFENDETQVHVRIVGDGSARASLEKLSHELGIADRVEFMGWVPVPDVYTEFAKAEIFCGLSRSEALGNVFLEAQAAGCVVIGTNVGGIPDSVEDGVTGLLVPMDDVKAAQSALKKLVEDAELRQKLIAAAKEHVQKYDWQNIAERYAEVYEDSV